MQTLSQLIDTLRRQAEESLEIVGPNEVRNWQRHPATVYILKQLEADYLNYHLLWENGHFTAESDSGTIQANSKALGALEALCAIAESIDIVAELAYKIPEEED